MAKGRFLRLDRDSRGAAALEFALVAPVLILFIIGIVQVGILAMANAGLSSAIAEGARFASIHPQPSNAQITQRITDKRFGLDSGNITGPSYGTGVSNGANYLDITMSYTVPLDFIFFQTAPVTITETRRVYTYSPTGGSGGSTSSTSSTGGTSSTSSTGGTSSASSTGGTTSSTGGTTSSTGGTTSSTSSTGGTTTSASSTSTSSTSSTSSGNGNGNSNGGGNSNGNSNGGGNGNGNGNGNN